jgi:quinol monooxygenase YgiN
MIAATLKMELPGHARDEILQVLKSLRAPTRAEAGCISCHVYQDLHDENRIVLREVWESQADLDRHIRSHRYRHLLALMETASSPPEIRFDTISHTAGIEVVRAARHDAITGSNAGRRKGMGLMAGHTTSGHGILPAFWMLPPASV